MATWPFPSRPATRIPRGPLTSPPRAIGAPRSSPRTSGPELRARAIDLVRRMAPVGLSRAARGATCRPLKLRQVSGVPFSETHVLHIEVQGIESTERDDGKAKQ